MRRRLVVWAGILVMGLGLVFVAYRWLLPRYSDTRSNSNPVIYRWFNDPASRSDLTTTMNRTTCPDAPFSLPSDGLIGLLWSDPAAPYTIVSQHTGLDVFGDGEPGTVPVYAAYDGLLTRRGEWLSSVIIKHDDPLQTGRTIWTYYTHMAPRDGSRSFIVTDFPAGTTDVPVKRGDLLGYQGEYAGAGVPIGMHLHFSIVTTADDGTFKNEAVLGNTLDPSPYFGMPLNIAAGWPERPIQCSET